MGKHENDQNYPVIQTAAGQAVNTTMTYYHLLLS